MIDESNFEKALYYLDQILKIEPNNTNTLNNKGGVLINMGNYSSAITNFDSVLAINENNTEALNNKAIALYKQELYLQSLRTFQKSLLADPTNENTFNNTVNVVDKLYWVELPEKSYVVVSVRDKNNNLVGYSKSNQINIQPPLGYDYLREHGNEKDVEIDGQITKVLEFSGSLTHKETQFVARADLVMGIGDFRIKVVEILLNGFIASFDDKITYTIIIVDPVF